MNMKNGSLNIAVCISGGGTTMKEILRACKSRFLLHVNPALVISSKPDAGGIVKAMEMGFPEKDTAVIVRKEFENPDAFGEAILRECRLRNVDLVAQCGFTPTMPPNVIAEYRKMIFNQHPGPLDGARPGFGGKGMRGLAVHHAVLHFAQRVGRSFMTEATVHRVTDEVDGGAILGNRLVQIWKDDDAEKLAVRVLPYEHNLVVETLLRFSEMREPREIHRGSPLIEPGEEALLEEAIAAGVAAFPNG
ncbi:MAG: formyltransferase family protein [Patescibacteria group bacterium]